MGLPCFGKKTTGKDTDLLMFLFVLKLFSKNGISKNEADLFS